MKRLFFFCFLLFASVFAFGQEITDTAAFIKNSGDKDYIKVDGNSIVGDFFPTFVTRLPNQALLIAEKDQPKMLIALPSKISSSRPEPGTYNVMAGKKLAVKKGSQIARLDIKPNFISVDEGGKVLVFYYNELYWFFGENISIIDTKTNEVHKISFKISMFIQ